MKYTQSPIVRLRVHFSRHCDFGGGSTPKNPNPKWDFKLFLGFLGFLGFLEKGVESTYLNIPDHLRPTCFLHFFREISPGSDT